MPWIDPIDDYAAPPRLPRATPEVTPWPGTYEGGDGVLRVECVEIGAAMVAAESDIVELLDVVATGTTFVTDDGGRLDIIDCVLTDCDLSRTTVGTIRGSRLVGCKLAGTDLSERTIRDSVVERCALAYTNLRRATVQRVDMTESKLTDCDLFEAELEDVTFTGSHLEQCNNERTRCDRVDLRGAVELGLDDPTNLRGCLLDDAGVLRLTYPLALRAGATIERDPADDQTAP